MGLLERFILARSEKHLEKYRRSALQTRTKLFDDYKKYLPELERCYKEAKYWHGTGRFHHYRSDDTRYSNVQPRHITNVFESILEEGGLVGHPDLWFQDGNAINTVSVAPLRMHARLFAHIHLREGVWLPYVFGGTRFWMSLFFILIAVQLNWKDLRFIIRVLFTRRSLRHFKVWGGAIRQLDRAKTLPIWRAYDLRSDIAGNYGILFGIKQSAISSQSLLPVIQNYETRVGGTILLSDMTHIEVPLNNVAQTKKLLTQNNISLPVIPWEFGELYVSQFPLSTLVYA